MKTVKYSCDICGCEIMNKDHLCTVETTSTELDICYRTFRRVERLDLCRNCFKNFNSFLTKKESDPVGSDGDL